MSTLLFIGEATGTNESLKQSQRLLQQAKADNAEALGKISALEKELTAFRDTKEEVHAFFLPVEGLHSFNAIFLGFLSVSSVVVIQTITHFQLRSTFTCDEYELLNPLLFFITEGISLGSNRCQCNQFQRIVKHQLPSPEITAHGGLGLSKAPISLSIAQIWIFLYVLGKT